MSSQEVLEQFDWVHARSACRAVNVFKELEQSVREDVDAAQSLVPARSEIKFSVVKAVASRFSVVRVEDPMTSSSRSVDFAYGNDRINVYDDKDQLMYSATLTLNNQGACRLLVNDEQLTQWQFRRMALEKLFFGPFE
jgi:hypothetical protein